MNEHDDWDKKMFEELNKQAIEFLKEAGLYTDFLEWQKKHGLSVPKDQIDRRQ